MDEKQIKEIYKEFATPLHVARHCRAVADFAVELGKGLIAAGEKIDLDLVRAAALLHDFVRVVDFRSLNPEKFPDPISGEDIEILKRLREKYKGRRHADAGAEILAKKGFADIANVVKKHKFLQIEEGFETWEEKLVYYADKRVKHHSVVT